MHALRRLTCLTLFLLVALVVAGIESRGDNYGTYLGAEPVGPSGDSIPVSSLGKSAIGLQIEPVARKSLPLQIATTGKIEAIPTREYVQHAMLSGRVTQTFVGLGSVVSQGQVLVTVDSPEINQLASDTIQNKADLEAEIRRTRATLDAEVNQAQAQLDLAKANYDRDKKLFDEGIGSQKQSQTSFSELVLAENRLKSSQQNRDITVRNLKMKLSVSNQSLMYKLRQLGVPVARIDKMLATQQTILEVPVTSTRAGEVTEIQANIGESIDPAFPLFRVSDLRKVWATADIYEDDMSRIKRGQQVVVKVGALPHESFQGKLAFIGKEVSPQTRTLPVRVEIDNPQTRIKPDMFAQLFIETEEPAMSVMVPQEAVVRRTGHNLVFTEVKGGFQPTRVALGRSFGDEVEVLAGISPGQRIVTRGAYQLDAELLKSHGGEGQFVQPTEGDELAEHGEHQHAQNENPSFSMQIIIVLIAAAFLIGFAVSAIFVKTSRAVKRAESGRQLPVDSERVSKG